jgi:hypothetical protein
MKPSTPPEPAPSTPTTIPATGESGTTLALLSVLGSTLSLGDSTGDEEGAALEGAADGDVADVQQPAKANASATSPARWRDVTRRFPCCPAR